MLPKCHRRLPSHGTAASTIPPATPRLFSTIRMRIRAAHLLRASLALFPLRSVAFAEAPVNLPRLCYTSENQLSPSYVLPCFTRPEDDGEVHSCCLAGDYCLTNQACYNVKRGIKYQKGCTDKGYNHYNCPKKCETDQTKADWVGLIHCNGSNGTPDNAWVSDNGSVIVLTSCSDLWLGLPTS